MSGHTPGPWFVQPFFLTIYNLSAGHSGATCAVAKALREQPGDEQAHFNAHLIAAAPLLLAACKAIVQAGSDTAEVVKQAERAIAAAEPKP